MKENKSKITQQTITGDGATVSHYSLSRRAHGISRKTSRKSLGGGANVSIYNTLIRTDTVNTERNTKIYPRRQKKPARELWAQTLA